MNDIELQKSLKKRLRTSNILGLSKGVIVGAFIGLGISLCKDLNTKHSIGAVLIASGVTGSLQYFINSGD